MTTAKNITILADGGYVSQAIQMCEIQSLSVSYDGTANDYLFSDGSCVRVENRVVTEVNPESA